MLIPSFACRIRKSNIKILNHAIEGSLNPQVTLQKILQEETMVSFGLSHHQNQICNIGFIDAYDMPSQASLRSSTILLISSFFTPSKTYFFSFLSFSLSLDVSRSGLWLHDLSLNEKFN